MIVYLIFQTGSNRAYTRSKSLSPISNLNGLSKIGTTAVKIANSKVNLSIIQVLTRGILANWLVCLAVMLAVSAKDITGKIFACFFPIMAFVTMEFEHSIANMYFLPVGLFATGGMLESLTIQSSIINIGLATIGNIIGGTFFVATLYWTAYLRKQDS